MVEWYVYAIGSALLGTIFVLLRKKALKKEHALEFESARSISMAFLLLLFLPFIKINVDLKILALLYFATFLGSVGIIFTSRAYRHDQISHVFPLANLRPFFVLILAYLFLGETVTSQNIVGIIILLLGAYALEADHHFSDLLYPIKSIFKTKSSFYMISAIGIFSITALIDKYLIDNYFDPITLLFLAWIFIAINLNVYHGFKFGFREIKQVFKETNYLPILIAVFSIGANLLYLTAIQKAYVSLVTPVIMLSTLFVVFIGGNFFKEDNVLSRVLISTAMLAGVYLIIT